MAGKRVLKAAAESPVAPAAAPAKAARPRSSRKKTESVNPLPVSANTVSVAATVEHPVVSSQAAPHKEVTVRQATHEEIARLAYAIWEARGGQDGSPDEDWLRAEQQLRLRAAANA